MERVVQGARGRPLLEQLSVKDCASSTVLHRHMVVFEKPEPYAKTLCGVVPCPQFARLYTRQKTSWARVVGFELSRVLASFFKADWLKELDLGRLGHVWVPADTVVLGEEAGHADVSYSSTASVFLCACAHVA